MCRHVWQPRSRLGDIRGTGGVPEGVGMSSSVQATHGSRNDMRRHRKPWLGVCRSFRRPGDVSLVSDVAGGVPKGVGTLLCMLGACGGREDASRHRDMLQHVGPRLGDVASGPDGLRRLNQCL